MIIDLPSPVAVVCHDAGAANHVVAWLRADGDLDRIRPYMAGPARKIWEVAFPGVDGGASLETALAEARSLLSGTGWASALEHEARIAAHRRGMPSAAMVDHWVNYEARFVRSGGKMLPDEVWVVDEYAEAIAERALSECRIRRKEDLYSKQLLGLLPPVESVCDNRFLYILEPMRSDWGRGVQGEFQALDYMIERLPLLGLPDDMSIHLRPHPSDPPGKYDSYLSRTEWPTFTLDEGSLMAGLAAARWVAGCESYALTLALRAGRQVFCTLPPWAPPCRLPQAGLIHLKTLEML